MKLGGGGGGLKNSKIGWVTNNKGESMLINGG